MVRCQSDQYKEDSMPRHDILIPPYDTGLFANPIQDHEIAGVPGALDKGLDQVDPVTFSVVHARIEGVMNETEDRSIGILNAMELAADGLGVTLSDLLSETSVF